MDPGDRPVEDHTEEIAGMPVFWRSAPWDGSPVVYLHGVPTSSDDWVRFLARTGGVAPDLPGFGRSAKRGDFDYTIAGYRDFLAGFLDHLGMDRLRLVVHDWGAVGLALAQEQPQRIERLLISNAVPLLPGYRWHRVARVWRTRLAGELAMGATTRWGLRQLSREAQVKPGPLPAEMVDSIWRHFDQGTQRAILRLYRGAPESVLASAGQRLGDIDSPALVLWGARDPYLPASFGAAYAARLPNAQVRLVPDAGHWPWIDRPEVLEEACRFVTAQAAG